MYDLVILYSGGADSMLMLEFCKDLKLNPFCVLIDYGQRHIKELEFAKNQLFDYQIDNQIVKIVDLNINSGLTGDGKENKSGIVHPKHVPGRNSIFLSLAYSIAEDLGIHKIWCGMDYSDRIHLFPDCYQEYIVKANEMFAIAGPNLIQIEAPLLGITKENVIRFLKNRGISEKDMYSGYGEFS